MREPWIGYVKRVLGLYSFTFLSSPELKYRAERDGVLGFSTVVLRPLRKLTLHTSMESCQTFTGRSSYSSSSMTRKVRRACRVTVPVMRWLDRVRNPTRFGRTSSAMKPQCELHRVG